MSSHAEALRLKFARNLAAARSAKAMTQEALANAAGVSRATVVQIESGIGDIKLSTVAELASALGTSPILMLMGEDELAALNSMLNDPGEVEKIRATLDKPLRHSVPNPLHPEKRAGKIGARAAHTAGLSGGAAVGAAIGTIIFPGVGTAFGAALGSVLGRTLIERRNENRRPR